MRLVRWLLSVTATLVVFGACLWLFRFATWSWLPRATSDHWAVATAFASVAAGAVGAAGAWWAGREPPSPAALTGEAMLEVTQVRFTHDAEFDILLRNLGDVDIVIHHISIEKLNEAEAAALPILNPSARYHIPVDDIPVGGMKTISVSHVVPARSADRLLVATHTTAVYPVEITFHYDRNRVVQFKARTWM